MALTIAPGPLAARTGPANYSIDGPKHRILLTPQPKRLRVLVGDGHGSRRAVLDTTRAFLLHETNLLPRYYVPVADLDTDLFVASPTTSHCPFKGDATYSSARVGDRVVADLVWRYETPNGELPELAGLAGLYLEKLDTGVRGDGPDAVMEEEQVLLGHPRDPFHRVDAWPSSRHVVVRRQRPDGEPVVLADTTRPVGVFETSLQPRWYVPREDVHMDLLRGSDTVTVCPYKGVASYHSVVDGPADVAWSYEDPLPEALAAAGHLSFDGEGIEVLVDA